MAQCTAEEMSRKTWLDHSASEKRSLLSNQNTHTACVDRQTVGITVIHLPCTYHTPGEKQAVLWLSSCLSFFQRRMRVTGLQAKGGSQKPFTFHVK